MSTASTTEIKFTPGPWGFGSHHSPENTPTNCVTPEMDSVEGKGWFSKNIWIKNSKGEIIADVKAYTTSGFVQDFDQWAANARLIVAAPCLLEAAQYAVECLERLNNELGQIGDNGDQALNALKDAIQKATTI